MYQGAIVRIQTGAGDFVELKFSDDMDGSDAALEMFECLAERLEEWPPENGVTLNLAGGAFSSHTKVFGDVQC